MKKKIMLIIAITLLSCMTACGTAPAETEESTNIENTNVSEESNTPQYIKANQDFYKNGVIYYKRDGTIVSSYFLDFDTMESSPLCAIPNCTHKLSNCLATQLGYAPVLYNDFIYFFEYEADVCETTDGSEFYMESKLKKASLSSSETQTVCEFTDAVPRAGNGYILNGSELYFIAYDPDPYEDGYGGYSWASVGGRDYICSINLESGEYHNYGEVCYVENEYPSADNTASAKILGYYNGKMYIGYSFVKDYPDEVTVDTELEWTLYNFTFDLETKELIESELPYSAFMNENSYAYYEDENHFTVIDQGQTYHFEGIVNEVHVPVYNNKVFGLYSWFDLTDQSEHSLGKYAFSEDSEWELITYYNGYYIFKNPDCVFEKVSEEELLAL